jgi:serine/threonine protein kinase/Flp pilus assembly protein TadD
VAVAGDAKGSDEWAMTSDRWQRIEQLYHATLEREENQRAAFLKEACAGDDALRQEVESLLAHEKGVGSFLEAPALEAAAKMLSKDVGRSLVGHQIGSYQVLSLLGAGGMGEVYEARDSKLGRNVAIKVLPAAFAHDPERLSRFEREARMLASLNHPNIATIHGLEQTDGVQCLVMELVPGETLAERLNAGALGIEEALQIGGQIAEALEAAHEKGVIHRDLKPANVKVTPQGRVKVLDFGLAKAFAGDGGLDLSNAPTLTAMGTEDGRILGTPAYMSPEQTRGKAVDKRTDIWAFGCVLYELLTARQAFRGETLSDTIATVLEREPDWQALPPATPAKIHDLLRRCLQKDLQRRLRDLGDARIEIEEALAPSTHVARRNLLRRAALPLVITAMVLLSALVGMESSGWRNRLPSTPRSPHIQSLAVLPLENFSRDSDQEYFADGMTQALITDLAKISALRVISRTSAMHYKGTHMTLPEIAKELKVDGVVEGSVQRSGTHVKITAQLIEAPSEKILWSSSYERDLKDVLALQDEVARAVAGGIQVKLTPQEQARLSNARPVNPEAQEAFLRAESLVEHKGLPEVKKIFEYLQLAIEKDPSYAPAYAELGEACGVMASMGLMPRDEALQRWRAAASKAIELDDTLAAAHESLGNLREYEDWDWYGAEKEYKRALELDPSDAGARGSYAAYLESMGRLDEAVAEIERTRELDPLSHNINAVVGMTLYYSRQYDRAIAAATKGLELEPKSPAPHDVLGLVYEQEGQLDRAITEFQKARALQSSVGGPARRLAQLGHAYAISGKSAEAQGVLAQMKRASRQYSVPSFDFAIVYLGLGEKNEAFHWMDRAFNERPSDLPSIKIDPRFDGSHSDPRYQVLLRRMGLPL